MKIKTLISVTQKGAHRFLSLQGEPADVQKDIYFLFNNGLIQEIPEEYREGADDAACVVTSEYRMLKHAKAAALSTIANKGRRAGGKMKLAIETKTAQILKHLRDVFGAEKCPFESGAAHEYSLNI